MQPSVKSGCSTAERRRQRTRDVLFRSEYLLLYQSGQGKSIPKRLPMRPPRLLAAYHNKSGHKRCGGFWQRAKQHAGRLAEEVLPPRHSSAGGICPFSPKPKRRRGRAAAVVPYAASCPFDRTLGFPSPPPHSGGGDRDGSAVFPSLKKFFLFSPGLLTFVRHKGLSYSQQKNAAHRRTKLARPPPCMQAANTRRSPGRSAAREKGVSTKNRICLWAYYHLPKGQMQAILALNETEERQEDKRK